MKETTTTIETTEGKKRELCNPGIKKKIETQTGVPFEPKRFTTLKHYMESHPGCVNTDSVKRLFKHIIAAGFDLSTSVIPVYKGKVYPIDDIPSGARVFIYENRFNRTLRKYQDEGEKALCTLREDQQKVYKEAA